jgi:hypothetical protein
MGKGPAETTAVPAAWNCLVCGCVFMVVHPGQRRGQLQLPLDVGRATGSQHRPDYHRDGGLKLEREAG